MSLPRFFFAFLVIILVIFTPSCCSYCLCSTGSNSHTVVLSKPASSYSPCSIVLCPHKNTRTCLPIFYHCVRYSESTAVVLLQCISGCGKSTIKVRQKYAESKAYVRLKYGKSTVKYGTVRKLFLGAYCTYIHTYIQ